jgi:spore coat protein U-like protein
MIVAPHRLHRRLPAMVFGLAAALAVPPSIAATCNLQVQGVSFGSYDFQSSQNLDSVGHVIVSCDASTSYSIALGPGIGSYDTRLMQNGAHQLAYNLYTDIIHSTVWGDGSNGSVSMQGSGTDVDYPVYGSVPAGQNPYVGAYSDTLTVVVTF